jgi:hypothetical protein
VRRSVYCTPSLLLCLELKLNSYDHRTRLPSISKLQHYRLRCYANSLNVSPLTTLEALSLGFAVLLISMLLALPVTVILTLAIIRTFRNWVKRSMEETAPKPSGPSMRDTADTLERSELVERPLSGTALGNLDIKQIAVISEQTRFATAVPHVAALRQRERRLAAIFSFAACVHPLILAGVMTVSSYKPSTHHQVATFLLLYGSFFLVTATPVALAATMILTKQLRFLFLSVLALLAALLVLDWAVHGSNLVTLWLMFAGLPTGVILLLNARRVRAVGPIVFAATLLLFCAIVASQFYGALYLWEIIGPVRFVREDLAQLPMLTAATKYMEEVSKAPAEAIGVLMSHPSSIVRAEHPERLTTKYTLLFASISLIIVVIGAAIGWAFLRWLALRYQTRRSSDQMLTVDVLMAIFALSGFSFSYSAFGLTAAACALAGFGGYKLLAHWLLRPRIGLTPPGSAPTLLLLRVFRSNRTGQPLLEKITQRWRYLGPIRLIAGTDFADTIIEPHEFFEFLSRRLSRAFVKNREDLEDRLSGLTPRPDPDGLYRIEDFFCHKDTWQMTVACLAKQANVMLMDLRGFSSARRGCRFEIEMLLNSVPVNRVVFVVDKSTDRAHLEETFRFAWNSMPSSSPNASGGQHQVSLVQASGHQRTVDSLLRLLCAKTQQS